MLPSLEEILFQKEVGQTLDENTKTAIKEWGKTIRDKTLEWAAKHAETEVDWEGNTGSESYTIFVDPKSIFLGKTHKDLEI